MVQPRHGGRRIRVAEKGQAEGIFPLSALPRLIPKIVVPVAVPMPMPRMSGNRPQQYANAGGGGDMDREINLTIPLYIDGVKDREVTKKHILEMQRRGGLKIDVARNRIM